MDEVGTLQLFREPWRWRDRFRAYKVLVDGDSVGAIKNGRTETFAVDAGEHTLRLGIDWTGSNEERVTIHPGETVAFVCRPAVRPSEALWAFMRSILTHDRWIILERRS